MELIKLGQWYYDDLEENANKINLVANQCSEIIKAFRENGVVSGEDMGDLFTNIGNVLINWTGYTYVGHKKEKPLLDAYQAFFDQLYHLITRVCMCVDDSEIQKLAKSMLYQGTLYRYLGNANAEECGNRIVPEYNNIWVSWSKNKDNSYLKSKLYGTITRLECNTGLMFGIDLEPFGVVRGDESEVVFPTLESLITNVEYL